MENTPEFGKTYHVNPLKKFLYSTKQNDDMCYTDWYLESDKNGSFVYQPYIVIEIKNI